MILNQRIKRELKENPLQYGALFFLIVLSMSIVISMASATDSVFHTVDTGWQKNHVEDGEFHVLVPYSGAQAAEIEALGLKLEENFYIDLDLEGMTFRIFKNRMFINTLEADTGGPAEHPGEIVLEKRYAAHRGLKAGDTVQLKDQPFTVTGIGSVPDYAYVKKNPYDVAADPDQFTIAFVSPETFADLKNYGNAELCYSYLLTGDLTDKQLKNHLTDMDFDRSMISNRYLLEMVAEAEKEKQELAENLDRLAEGSGTLKDGITGLNDGLDNLTAALQSLSLSQDLGTLNPELDALYDGSAALSAGGRELGGGAFALDQGVQDLRASLIDFWEDQAEDQYVNLSYFLVNQDNPRINDVKTDCAINKFSALFAGLIILLLLAYVISVFIVNTIEKESAVIGTLYAHGYVKNDLVKHFLILPLLLVTAASLGGTVTGYWLIPLMDQSSGIYSFPRLQAVIKPYAMVYGIAAPILIAASVNFFVINKKLSLAPLQLLRRETKQSRIANLDLGGMSFIRRYRVRQLLREIRGNITIVLGLFLAILLMVFAVQIKGSIDNYVEHTTDDAKFNYMYILQYPEDEVPAEGEEAYSQSLYTYFDIIDGDLEVNLLGIEEDNPYFKFTVPEGGNRDDVYISNSVAYKFGYKTGDSIILTDSIENKGYKFQVAGIVPYSNGLYIFANLDHMRKTFAKDDDFYNTVLAAEELAIEPGRIASVIHLRDLAKAASKFNEIMAGLIVTLLAGSVLIFIVVLYLLLRMMVNKATFSISLLKVFGYQEKDVKKIYLGSASYTVLLAAALGIPVSRLIVKAIWPYMISNVAAGFESYIPRTLYLAVIGIILLSYLAVNFSLAKHLQKVTLVEILKNRE
ncbi:ABC transporter permease [Desulfosporosinus youngiae]|uniref:ABC-type transport system, involved in lipoprotein release, permease component n=1 Tax=Desulfosporosinus youngiae DSM 17734 TaxID=768710 RepID=H5XU11_9FIRM|nr:ABC transporter permease [Desulfosporosinus youngiae]EHQ88969.1 ABC-type transport system, involved in lipoprotein release, permease component [Desulfosporosinus youngiae DSM 17734]